ncbi:MAG: FAD-dependent oxidoreductase, partial [Actinomycetota bacterium]
HLAGDAIFHEPSGGRRLSGNPIDVPSGRFTAGAEALARGLADLLPPERIHLSTPVIAIEQPDPDGDLLVTTAPGQVTSDPDPAVAGPIRAGHVILALPPALAVHRLRFAPPLPDRLAGLAAATPVWMASVAKVVASYRQPFWRERGLAGAAISHLGPMGEIHDMSGPDGDPAVLFGFARLLQADQPPPDRAAIEHQLAALFGPDAPAPTDVVIHDWRAEADTTPIGTDGSTAYQLFGHPLYQTPTFGGRLHWASTETATVSPGHIEGAMASGERAAAAIVAATDPHTTRSAS